QFRGILVTELVLAATGCVILGVVNLEDSIQQILYGVCMVLTPFVMLIFSNFLLQITDKIQGYAKLVIVERVSFVFLVCLCIANGYRKCTSIMYMDLACKIIAALYGAWLIKEIFVKKTDSCNLILREAWTNISVGIKLLLANLSGMLILGIVRFGIAYQWSVATFGKVSLILSISNFVMVFINSLSVVLFPILKRIDVEKQCTIYVKVRSLMTMVMLVMLLMYYPLHDVFIWWLPKYEESIRNMALLFPIFLFESRVILLTNTYFKSLRYEGVMLKCNMALLGTSLLFTVINIYFVKSLDIMVFSITLLFLLKNLLAEYLLSRALKLHVFKMWFQEIALVSLFVAINYFFENSVLNFVIYGFALTVYFYVNRSIVAVLKNAI
ncbi:MAG: hypothetical protein SOZ52_09520, partial [Pyramidobacter sp.]|nr:hypothetical protein [Pyramidobacter sp.]